MKSFNIWVHIIYKLMWKRMAFHIPLFHPLITLHGIIHSSSHTSYRPKKPSTNIYCPYCSPTQHKKNTKDSWHRKHVPLVPMPGCVLSKEHSKDWKTKSGASSASRSGMLEGTCCLETMRLKIMATNEILQSMFLSHDQSQGAIPRIRLRIRSWLLSNTNSLVATKIMILSWKQIQAKE